MFTREIDFLEVHILASRVCCTPKFLHAPQNSQVLLACTPQKMGVSSTIFFKFHVDHRKIGELEFTNNKVLLSHSKPPKFNIALAIHVYDNAVAFGPRDFAANEISIP